MTTGRVIIQNIIHTMGRRDGATYAIKDLRIYILKCVCVCVCLWLGVVVGEKCVCGKGGSMWCACVFVCMCFVCVFCACVFVCVCVLCTHACMRICIRTYVKYERIYPFMCVCICVCCVRTHV